MITIRLKPEGNFDFWDAGKCEELNKLSDDTMPNMYDLIDHEFVKLGIFVLEQHTIIHLNITHSDYYLISLNEGDFITRFFNGDMQLCISEKGKKISFKCHSGVSSIKNVSHELLIMAVIEKKTIIEFINLVGLSMKRLEFSTN